MKNGTTKLLLVHVLLLVGFSNPLPAASGPSWNSRMGEIRTLAENNAPLAYQQALSLQPRLPLNEEDRIGYDNLLSRIELYLARLDEAEAHAEAARRAAVKAEDPDGQVEASINLTYIKLFQGNLEAMYQATREGFALYEKVVKASRRSEILQLVALMYQRTGKQPEATALALRNLSIAQDSYNALALAYAHKALAIIFSQTNHRAEAKEAALRMREQARLARSKLLEAEALSQLATLAKAEEDFHSAEALSRESLALRRELGGPHIINLGLLGLADLLKGQGKAAAALLLVDEAIEGYRRYPNRLALWWALSAHSGLVKTLGLTQSIFTDAEEAYALAREIGAPYYLAASARNLADLASSRGDFEKAYRYLLEAGETEAKDAQNKVRDQVTEVVRAYEQETQRRAIEALTRKNQEQELALSRQQAQSVLFLTIALACLVVAVSIGFLSIRLKTVYRQVLTAKEELKAVVKAIPDPLFEVGLSGGNVTLHTEARDDAAPWLDSSELPSGAAATCRQALAEAHETGRSLGRQFSLPAGPSQKQWYELSVSPAHRNPEAEPRFLVLLRNITDRRKAEEQIQTMAYTDALLGLPNRRMLRERGEALVRTSEQSCQSFAVFFLDIDHFKRVNDAHGHTIGDILLISIVDRLKGIPEVADGLFHFSGDKFVILLPNAAAVRCSDLAEQIKDAMSTHHMVGTSEFFFSLSIGIALFPSHSEDLDGLLRCAEIAMYQSKRSGRNGCQYFTPAYQKQAHRVVRIESALHYALINNEFSLVFQPQVSLEDGRVLGAEALLRWNHPVMGAISPGEFIPIAEESGHILSLGTWVLRKALEEGRRWRLLGLPPLVIAVNLSVTQFRDPGLASLVSDLLEEYEVPPSLLELEITESVAMNNPDEVTRILNHLATLGVHLAVDDFGTGYSSLSYLRKFPFTKVKIDQSFVRDLLADPGNLAIVRAIIGVSRGLGLRIIAEGVENEGQADLLAGEGCGEAQGFYFSSPLPSEEFIAFARAGRSLQMCENQEVSLEEQKAD